MEKRLMSIWGLVGLVMIMFTANACKTEVHELAQDATLPPLTVEKADQLAGLALGCILREYPNKTGHVMNDSSELWSPAEMHPAFYGCFDWHSSVHGHWMLVRLLKLYPDMPRAGEIRAALDQNLRAENIQQELAYFRQANRKSFERTYGWAWLLKLAEELGGFSDPQAQEWFSQITPLANEMVALYTDFLPRQDFPIRTGVHPNTAFGLAFALDYARAEGLEQFEDLLTQRSLDYYLSDTDAPTVWEPGGEDFFSPALMEADLMRRVLDTEKFSAWLGGFIPDLDTTTHCNLLFPVVVSDRSDPKIVHLDGLNLSRAWCLLGISRSLPEADPNKRLMREAGIRHAREALQHITSGNYEGEHWLASFAVYLLSL